MVERRVREILEYLEAQARDSAGRQDAAVRLAYFSREAWFVADAAADADKAAAVAVALRIDELAPSGPGPVTAAGRPPGGPGRPGRPR